MRKDVLFGKRARHRVVDRAARGKVAPQRLFQADPRAVSRQPGIGEALDRGFEQVRRGGQEDRQALGPLHRLGQRVETFGRGDVAGDIAQPVEEIRHAATASGRQVLLQRGAGELAELGIAQLRARGADDAQGRRHQLVGMKRGERGDQHPPRQVAGGAEQQQRIGHSRLSLALDHLALSWPTRGGVAGETGGVNPPAAPTPPCPRSARCRRWS